MFDMGLDNIVHNYRETCDGRILNAQIDDQDYEILKIKDQENEQRLLQKYKNIRFLDDKENQTYLITPDNLEFKGPTIRNKQYCVVGRPLNCRYADNLDLLVSRDLNDDFMVFIKGL